MAQTSEVVERDHLQVGPGEHVREFPKDGFEDADSRQLLDALGNCFLLALGLLLRGRPALLGTLARRETPAPFWIAASLDGQGASYYTFGDRKAQELESYFEQALAAFTSIARIADKGTLVVQMLAFAEPEWQLKRYVEMMNHAGFREVRFRELANGPDGRIWRSVPNRKWYASQRGTTPSSNEVVLFHTL